jgi:hypothetical protein
LAEFVGISTSAAIRQGRGNRIAGLLVFEVDRLMKRHQVNR